MNIYVETNFIFELVFEQEQHASCENILQLCDRGQMKLVIPAYSFAEPHEKLTRQARIRRDLQKSLERELGQLYRTKSYIDRIENIQNLTSLILQSNDDERQRFIHYRDRLLNRGDVIALTADILRDAASYESVYDLKPQDAIIYASVLDHLRCDRPQSACFLNRNSKDFDSPDIVSELDRFNCRMIPRFDDGYRFLQSRLSS